MIKKIQQSLLVHCPAIWNIRLFPMLFILATMHLLAFGIGYLSGAIDFDDKYSSSNPFSNQPFVHIAFGLVGVLLLIGWLVSYSKNNALRSFYPQHKLQLFLEWIGIFVITAAITFLPLSVYGGITSRWKNTASPEEASRVIHLLQKIDILIPGTIDHYVYQPNEQDPIPISKEDLLKERLDPELYGYEYNREGIFVPTGYTAPSLLYYHEYYYWDDYSMNQLNKEQIKSLLRTGEKDKIRKLMSDFYGLMEKHHLSARTTQEEWFRIIYNPPYFPVNQDNVMEYDSFPFEQLKDGYTKIQRTQEDILISDIGLLIFLYIAVFISLFIFSFRVTGRKAWVVALIGTGILLFIVGFLGVILSSGMSGGNRDSLAFIFITSFWLILFTGIIINIISKIISKSHKGKSAIFLNPVLWLIPCIFPLLFMDYFFFQDIFNDEFRFPGEKTMVLLFSINLGIVLATMIPMSIFIRKWKSLADE